MEEWGSYESSSHLLEALHVLWLEFGGPVGVRELLEGVGHLRETFDKLPVVVDKAKKAL